MPHAAWVLVRYSFPGKRIVDAMIRRGGTREPAEQGPADDLVAEIFPVLERIGEEIERMLGGQAVRRSGSQGMAAEPATAPAPDRPTATLAEQRSELDRLLRRELEHQGIVVNGQDVARVVAMAAGKGIEWTG